MSVDGHLLHICTVQRATSVRDPYGNDRLTWSDWETNVMCRLVVRTQRVAMNALVQQAIVTTMLLLVQADTDVAEGDRITDMIFEDGDVDAGPWVVRAVLPRRARAVRHITLELERVT